MKRVLELRIYEGLHITHYTLHIAHYTLHITHYTLHIFFNVDTLQKASKILWYLHGWSRIHNILTVSSRQHTKHDLTGCTEHSLPACCAVSHTPAIDTAAKQMCRSCGEAWLPEPSKQFFPDTRLTQMYGGRLKLSILPRNLYTWREILIIFADYINHLVFLVLLKWVIIEKYVMHSKRD
jgi:hypothetical protein